jgi:hypothetical protein
MAWGTDDDVVYPVTGKEDLVAAGLSPEHDDDGHDPYALFDDNVARSPVPIDLDGNDAGAAATAIGTGMEVASNTNTTGGNGNGNGTPSSVVSGKRKSKCWDDFEEIYEVINGNKVRTQAICKLCGTTLSARSRAGTGHILRHQNSCKKKIDHAARVQSRLTFNPDGSLHLEKRGNNIQLLTTKSLKIHSRICILMKMKMKVKLKLRLLVAEIDT